MLSGSDWILDWPQAEAFSLHIGEVSSKVPLRGPWEPNDRIAFAMASFRLTQEHHSSVHLLFSRNRCASAYALARPLLEASLRTIWIAEDASEQDIAKLIRHRGKLPLLEVLSKSFSKRAERPLNAKFQELLHGYTHGGVKALVALSVEGEELERSNASIIAMAGFALGGATHMAAKLLGRRDLLEELSIAMPITD